MIVKKLNGKTIPETPIDELDLKPGDIIEGSRSFDSTSIWKIVESASVESDGINIINNCVRQYNESSD